MDKRTKDMVRHGKKSRAGTTLSALFRAVGNEATEMVSVKVPNVTTGQMERRLVTKLEAIVRDTFEMAMPVSPDDVVVRDAKAVYEARKMIFDRTGGRPGSDVDDDDGANPKADVAGRVSDLNKKRLNSFAAKSEDITSATTKKKTKKSKIPTVPMREHKKQV